MTAKEHLTIFVTKDEQKTISKLIDILDDSSIPLLVGDYIRVIRAIAEREQLVADVDYITIVYND